MDTYDNKNITIKDVALKAGVSQATVGRVIGGYGSVSPKTKNKVLKTIESMNYVPNAIAQSMKRKNTNTIGIIVGNIANPFFSEIVNSVEKVLSEAGYSLLISSTGEDAEQEVKALKTLHSKQVDGLLIATTQKSDAKMDQGTRSLYTGTIPTVYLDREIFSIGELCVKTDHFGGAYDATSYLIKKGHRNIGVIAGIHASTMYQRIEGYKRALDDNDIEFNPDYIMFGKTASMEESDHFAREILKHKEVTALFLLNDLICMGALIALHDLQISIPDDISIIGWDDFPMAQILGPPITMVTQDTERIGKLGAEKLLERIHGKLSGEDVSGEKRITLGTQLLERGSCKDIIINKK